MNDRRQITTVALLVLFVCFLPFAFTTPIAAVPRRPPETPSQASATPASRRIAERVRLVIARARGTELPRLLRRYSHMSGPTAEASASRISAMLQKLPKAAR